MTDLDEVFSKLGISGEKRAQVLRKPQIERNLARVFDGRDGSNKLLYTLACVASKKVDIDVFADLVERGVIKHESMLKESLKYAERKGATVSDICRFVEENDVDCGQVCEFIADLWRKGVGKKEMVMRVRNEMPCADFKVVMSEVGKLPEDEGEGGGKMSKEYETDWLEEGEVKKLFKPGENPQVSERIMSEHLSRTGGRVVTRFPPEPNGHLHIGHVKAINLSFEYARKFGGYTYLRYDDTNPRKEEEEYFDSIYEDVLWLGFKPYKVTASSDYFDKMIEFSFQLIGSGKAYVCHLSVEEICERRRRYSVESESGADRRMLSPYRDRDVEENVRVFQEMVDGKWGEGKACLRFKMDTTTRNPLMFDLVGMRIIDAVHPRKKVRYAVYPTYEFALCVSDSLEDVTHSFCTREFYSRQESYNWVIDQLGIYKPVQWEFSRLNVSNTVLSKRKILPLVKYGIRWDDPRLFTVKGMRRRGFTPDAINKFCRSVGLTFAETTVDVKMLENFVREDLNRKARRIMCVRDPLRVTILDAEPCTVDIPDFPWSDVTRTVPFTPTIYIERSDFMEDGDSEFLRLTPTQPVGLYMLYPIRVVSVSSDGIVAERCETMPKKFIHWVSEDCVRIEMRMYSALWTSFNPEDSDYLEEMNKDSLRICHGLCDKRILDAGVEDKVQFQRLGYFCVDRDTTEDNVVVNLTLPLKNTV